MAGLTHPPRGLPVAAALAYVGAVVVYTPVLTLLLPTAVAQAAGADRYAALALILCVGAVAAGASNLLFGIWSDRSRRRGGGRRRFVLAGGAAIVAAFAFLAQARGLVAIAVAVAAFQVALNAVLAPLLALIAEEVPRERTGWTTGLFAIGPLAGAVLTRMVAADGAGGLAAPLAITAALGLVCLVPLLTMPATAVPRFDRAVRTDRRGLLAAWGSRLLVQVAGNVLFTDLLFVMAGEGLATATVAGGVATLLLLANMLPLPVAALAGRRLDRAARGAPFLCGAALVAAAGLAGMAAASSWPGRAAGFLVFATGWGVFLPLQVGHVMRLLPDPRHVARDLGVLNLANTLPVLVGQALAWRLATPRDPAPLLAMLALLTAGGGLLMLAAVSRRRESPSPLADQRADWR